MHCIKIPDMTIGKGMTPYSNTYNAGWKDNPNFSQTKGPNQGGPSHPMPPLGFQKPPMPNFTPNLPNPQINSLEEIMKLLAQNTLQFQESTVQCLNSITQSIAKLEYIVSLLANSLSVRDKGTSPSQPEANPKGQIPKGQFEIHDVKGKDHEQVNSITTSLCNKLKI